MSFTSTPDLTTVPGTVFDVKFSPNTVKIEPEKFVRSLRSFSRDHTIFVFDKSSEVARSLQPGKVRFVPGLTFEKVIAVAEDGSNLVVGADDDTSLTDVIQNGTLKWDSVNFQVIRQRVIPASLAERTAEALAKTTFGSWLAKKRSEVLKAQGAAPVQLITSTSATVGSATALIPCQRTQLVMTGNAGINAQFFSLFKKDYELNFVKKESVILVPPIKGCQV